MSESALEFVAPLNVAGTNFNRNPRKVHVLQMDFGDGLVPIIVGTYPMDPTTGKIVPQGNTFYPPANSNNLIQAGASGQTLISSANIHDWRLYVLIVALSVAGKVTLKVAGANFIVIDIGTAASSSVILLGPQGIDPNDYGLTFGDLTETHTGGGTIDATVFYFSQ